MDSNTFLRLQQMKLEKDKIQLDDDIKERIDLLQDINAKNLYHEIKILPDKKSDSLVCKPTSKVPAKSIEKRVAEITNNDFKSQSHAPMIEFPNKWNLNFEDDDANKSFPFGSYEEKRKQLIAERKAEYNAFLSEKELQVKEKERKLELPKTPAQYKYENMVQDVFKKEEKFRTARPFYSHSDRFKKSNISPIQVSTLPHVATNKNTDAKKHSIDPIAIMDKRLSFDAGPSSRASLFSEPSSVHHTVQKSYSNNIHHSSAPGNRDVNFNFSQDDRNAKSQSILDSTSKSLNDDIRNKELYLKNLERMIQEKEQKLSHSISFPESSSLMPQADELVERLETIQVKKVDHPKNSIRKSVSNDNSSLRTTGFGIYSDHDLRKENERLKREKYKLELEAQVEENRRSKQLEKEKRLLEEKLEEQKRLEEQRRLQQQYEAEQAEQIRKQQEAELKRRRLLQLQNERILEEKQRQLKEEEERRRQKLLEKQEADNSAFYVPPQGPQSPPVPVMRAQAVMQNQPQEKKRSYTQDDILSQLSEIRRNIHANQKEDTSDNGRGVYIISDRRAVQEDSDDENDYHIIGQSQNQT